MSLRVAVYCRCSTVRNQDISMQVSELLEFCERKAFKRPCVFLDHSSGRNMNRPGLKSLLDGARAREFDAVIVWKFDRFARSLKELVTMIQELDELGLQFISLKDSVDLSTSHGQLMMHIIGAFAQFESDIIRERVNSGLANARRKGKRLGPPIRINHDRVIRMRQQGYKIWQIAKSEACSQSAVKKILREYRQRDPN